jgi:hypothetical protein
MNCVPALIPVSPFHTISLGELIEHSAVEMLSRYWGKPSTHLRYMREQVASHHFLVHGDSQAWYLDLPLEEEPLPA